MDQKLRLLFLCTGNSCRSQMAEAYARVLGKDFLEALSAGISPVGFIPREVVMVMEEEGISMEGHFSKSLYELPDLKVDLIVDLAGLLNTGPGNVPVKTCKVTDPFKGDLDDYRNSREEVLKIVNALIDEVRNR